MADVVRLPKQHPRKPHCAKCGRDLPTFDNADLTIPAQTAERDQLLGITFHIECVCGQVWDLRREVSK